MTISPPSQPGMLSKVGFKFISFDDESLTYSGDWESKGGDDACAIGHAANSRVSWIGVASEVVGVFVKHDWSGKIAVYRDGKMTDVHDLYSWYSHLGMIPLGRSNTDMKQTIDIIVVGANEVSRSKQMVLKGFLVKRLSETDKPNQTAVLEKAAALSAVEYAALQTAQMDRWDEDLRKKGIDPVVYAQQRIAAYTKRIAEALVYTKPGDVYLDIGGGSLQDSLLEAIRKAGVDYYYLDIDERTAEHNRRVVSKAGFPAERIMIGENSKLPFADGQLDFVFSSHCLEHSRVPQESFGEIRRALKSGGHLFFAVPVGWDAGPEHMYCFDESGWVEFTRDMGFEVLNVHVGCVYPESGHDLAIVARKPWK